MNMNKLLDGQTALITGGTAGIGKAIALKFAEAGARVVIFGTNKERGALVVAEIKAKALLEDVVFMAVDVANTGEVESAIKQVLERFGGIDILVNNAGVTKDQLLMKMSEADWDLVMGVNIKSCYNTSKALVRSLIKSRKGKIINISSVVGLTGNIGQANYAASKAAIIGFSKSLAKELASRNIYVNCIAPGFITTPMTEALSEEQKKTAISKIPLGRFGDPEEVANAALFLASHLSGYITGQTLVVDGGMTME